MYPSLLQLKALPCTLLCSGALPPEDMEAVLCFLHSILVRRGEPELGSAASLDSNRLSAQQGEQGGSDLRTLRRVEGILCVFLSMTKLAQM